MIRALRVFLLLARAWEGPADEIPNLRVNEGGRGCHTGCRAAESELISQQGVGERAGRCKDQQTRRIADLQRH